MALRVLVLLLAQCAARPAPPRSLTLTGGAKKKGHQAWLPPQDPPHPSGNYGLCWVRRYERVERRALRPRPPPRPRHARRKSSMSHFSHHREQGHARITFTEKDVGCADHHARFVRRGRRRRGLGGLQRYKTG